MYCTARVDAADNPSGHADQNVYLKALLATGQRGPHRVRTLRRTAGATSALRPSSPYGTSKLAADQASADLAATGAIGAISLRAFNIAGALQGHSDHDQTRLIPRLLAVQQHRAPEMVVNGDGNAVRDFVHVADMPPPSSSPSMHASPRGRTTTLG